VPNGEPYLLLGGVASAIISSLVQPIDEKIKTKRNNIKIFLFKDY
jgi:hypothetical protein